MLTALKSMVATVKHTPSANAYTQRKYANSKLHVFPYSRFLSFVAQLKTETPFA